MCLSTPSSHLPPTIPLHISQVSSTDPSYPVESWKWVVLFIYYWLFLFLYPVSTLGPSYVFLYSTFLYPGESLVLGVLGLLAVEKSAAVLLRQRVWRGVGLSTPLALNIQCQSFVKSNSLISRGETGGVKGEKKYFPERFVVQDGKTNLFIHRHVCYIWWLPKVWKDNFPDCWGWFNFLHYIISIVCIQSTLHKRYNTILLLK